MSSGHLLLSCAKKGSYHKNRPFRLLAVADLHFARSYLNDIDFLGYSFNSILGQTWVRRCQEERGAAKREIKKCPKMKKTLASYVNVRCIILPYGKGAETRAERQPGPLR